MTTAATPAQPSPKHFFQTATAYQLTAFLKTAVELELFTAIAEGSTTAAQLARRCAAAERGIRGLCDALVTIGFLTKDGETYGLTLDSGVFLDRRKPGYIGNALEFILSPTITFGFERLTDAVRSGGSVIGEGGTMSPEHPVWETFARAMTGLTAPSREFMAGLAGALEGEFRVLDIAAGHGMYGIEIAKRNPNARVVALDWPRVLRVAVENAKAHGVSEQWQSIEGNAFEREFGGPHHLVLLTNFLHHFDFDTCVTLLKKVRQAVADGGRVMTLEFVPNDDMVSPPGQALFNMTMLASTAKGKAYTFKELESMFATAGFARSELHDIPGVDQRIIVSWP